MSKKLVKTDDQPSLETYLSPSRLTRGELKSTISAKKRTLPSAEKPNQKKHCIQPIIMDTPADTTPKENQLSNEVITEEMTKHKKKKKALNRETIDCMKEAVRELIDPIEEKINMLLKTNEKEEMQEIEIGKIKTMQSELYRKCIKIERDQQKLKKHVEKLEEKMLESNLIMHGVREDAWELPENRKERIYNMIANTIDRADPVEQLNTARSIPIRTTTRLGRYREGRNRPISICFEKKDHADVLMESKGWLPRGVYIDCEYMQDIENQRKLLYPILKLARSKETYKGKCKMVDDHLVIHGMKYYTSDIHKLPADLSGFHASSKLDNDGRTLAFFGELSSAVKLSSS